MTKHELEAQLGLLTGRNVSCHVYHQDKFFSHLSGRFSWRYVQLNYNYNLGFDDNFIEIKPEDVSTIDFFPALIVVDLE